MLTAITRAVGGSLPACTLTFVEYQPIDVERAREQHRSYEARLARLGARVCRLPARDDLPDSAFVEDTTLVLDELAVVLPMGSAARRREAETVEPVLEHFRTVVHLQPPGFVEGGDVLRVDRTLYVGRSQRTNEEGIDELARLVKAYDYEVVRVEVDGCLHLKTGCTYAGDGVILINPDWIDATPFKEFELLRVPETEPFAANVLPIGGKVVMPKAFRRTRDLLERRGIEPEAVDVSELQKAEAGVTCMSLLFDSDQPLPATGELTLSVE